MTRRKPPTKDWAVHALDPKRSTSLSDVKDIVRYPLCGTADRGYGGFCFAKGPRFVTCKKCKKLLRAKPVISGTPPKPKVTRWSSSKPAPSRLPGESPWPVETQLSKDIREAINRACAENGSNTPDHILAEYMLSCLMAFDKAVQARAAWYGRMDKPGASTREVTAPVSVT